jgi:hypothetical protein
LLSSSSSSSSQRPTLFAGAWKKLRVNWLGGRDGGKEGRREGGKEGREGGNEGRRRREGEGEGGKENEAGEGRRGKEYLRRGKGGQHGGRPFFFLALVIRPKIITSLLDRWTKVNIFEKFSLKFFKVIFSNGPKNLRGLNSPKSFGPKPVGAFLAGGGAGAEVLPAEAPPSSSSPLSSQSSLLSSSQSAVSLAPGLLGAGSINTGTGGASV